MTLSCSHGGKPHTFVFVASTNCLCGNTTLLLTRVPLLWDTATYAHTYIHSIRTRKAFSLQHTGIRPNTSRMRACAVYACRFTLVYDFPHVKVAFMLYFQIRSWAVSMFRVLGKQKFWGVIHTNMLAYLSMCALSKQSSYLIDTTNTSIGVLIRI